MGTNRHSNTRAQTHILTNACSNNNKTNPRGRNTESEKKNTGTEKSDEEMRKAETGEDSRAEGTSQIDTEKLMRNCKEGCVRD